MNKYDGKEVSLEKQQKRPDLGAFNHVAIEVKDLQSALQFYQDILGLSVLPMPEGVKEKSIAWLDLSDKLALHIVQKEDAAPGKTSHFAFNVDDVDQWRKYLLSKNIEIFQPQIDIYSAQRIFVKDPSGNRLEFVKWQHP